MANVPTMDIGKARLGMMVAEMLRRKIKITITTRAMVRKRVNFTSLTESRMETERSYRISRLTACGIWARKVGSSFLMESTTSTVLVPGCRKIGSVMPRRPLNQLAVRSEERRVGK